MDVSILIPTFNFDCSRLVRDLCRAGETWGGAYEVVVGDDCSTRTDLLEAMEKALADLTQVRVLRSERNLGRACQRNRLAEEARGEWLLFIDSDAAVPADFSLTRYMEATHEADVVCGGLRHPEQNPCPEASLRYRYEREADKHRAARFRQLSPYGRLATFNLMVRRSVFLDIRFDEACTEYGYEDTLFGAELERRGIGICHIDCPLVHMGLEPNAVFLEKTETSLRTLRRLEGRMGRRSMLDNWAQRLRRVHLDGVVRCGYRLLRRPLRRNLAGSHPSLLLFSVYKLGYYLELL